MMARIAPVLAVLLIGCVPNLAFADAHPPRAVPEDAGPLQAIGPVETVFDWTYDRCNTANIPDLPARAYRDAGGQVNLIVSHYSAYRMVGADFDTLKVDCAPVLASRFNPDPSAFSHYEWLAATYTDDGATIHGLVHNEHHGHETGAENCPSQDYMQCWYNTITQVRSDDGGATYQPVAPSPAHFVAGWPEPYAADAGPSGLFSPSNILFHDGYYYVFAKAQIPDLGFQHVCLMRNADLADPGGWRFWDGYAFDGRFADPYRASRDARGRGQCAAIAIGEIAEMYESISWNAVLQKFVLIGSSNDPSQDPNIFGFYYALSDDLIHWDHRRPLLEVRLPWRAESPNAPVYLYPSLIDHDSPSRNFDVTGARAYLYFTRLNGGPASLDRDLLRIEVKIE